MDTTKKCNELKGNWTKFDSFSWDYEIDDPENWCIVYTNNRDSGLLTQSNSSAIEKIMTPFLEGNDCNEEQHNHWAVGWVDGYSIRVFDSFNNPTPAILQWIEIQERLEDYPLLDEDDYSQREYDAMIENLESQSYIADIDLPGDWINKVLDYCEENHQDMLENSDDTGAWIDCNVVFVELGWKGEK